MKFLVYSFLMLTAHTAACIGQLAHPVVVSQRSIELLYVAPQLKKSTSKELEYLVSELSRIASLLDGQELVLSTSSDGRSLLLSTASYTQNFMVRIDSQETETLPSGRPESEISPNIWLFSDPKSQIPRLFLVELIGDKRTTLPDGTIHVDIKADGSLLLLKEHQIIHASIEGGLVTPIATYSLPDYWGGIMSFREAAIECGTSKSRALVEGNWDSDGAPDIRLYDFDKRTTVSLSDDLYLTTLPSGSLAKGEAGLVVLGEGPNRRKGIYELSDTQPNPARWRRLRELPIPQYGYLKSSSVDLPWLLVSNPKRDDYLHDRGAETRLIQTESPRNSISIGTKDGVLLLVQNDEP